MTSAKMILKCAQQKLSCINKESNREFFLLYIIAILTLIDAGGDGAGIYPFVGRLAAISRRSHLGSQQFLTFPKMMLAKRQHSHFEHILNDCPEIGPSLPKTYKIFEANFKKVLTFPRMMLAKRWYNHFEHILNDCLNIGLSLLKTYKIFKANFRIVDFFSKLQ